MITEQDIEVMFAEIFLGIIKNPANKTTVETFCSEYHLDRNKLTSKKFFSMCNGASFRLWMGIAQLADIKEYLQACMKIAIITYFVANSCDGSPEAILQAHKGSPMKRKQ